MKICLPHCQEIRWIRHILNTDFTRLPANTLLILTDFAASMCLRAAETKNSSVDAHAVNDNFVCIYNRRIITLKQNRKRSKIEILEVNEWEDLTIWTCDVHHFFAETFSKGKKNDHQMHNVCLDALIKQYIAVFDELGTPLENITIWTDNAPNQYRCRQNFTKIATVAERFPGIKITHRLAVVDNFKGNHDAVGKDPSRLIKSLELSGIRSENALKVFVNCHRLEKSREDSEWIQYENENDIALKRKGKYGMDTRTVWYVVEEKEEYDRLVVKYPGRVLFIDRDFVMDTFGKESIQNTSKLHEICSEATHIQAALPSVWPIRLSNLPCNCVHCILDPFNTECKLITWRKTRTHNLQPLGVSPDRGRAWVGSGVCVRVQGQVVSGSIVDYSVDRMQQFWKVQVGENIATLNYAQICEAKNAFNTTLQHN